MADQSDDLNAAVSDLDDAYLEPGEVDDAAAVITELRRDLEALEAEYRESFGQLPPFDDAPS